jgi:pyruvate formate lyase activating enzyme
MCSSRTASSAKSPLKLLPFTDAMNIDVKAFTQEYYDRYCKGTLEAVKETVERAARSCHVEITTLVIPGLNDSPDEIGKLAKWLSSISSDIVLHLSRFFPHYKMLDIPPTPVKTLEAARDSALSYLKYVYLGNV